MQNPRAALASRPRRWLPTPVYRRGQLPYAPDPAPPLGKPSGASAMDARLARLSLSLVAFACSLHAAGPPPRNSASRPKCSLATPKSRSAARRPCSKTPQFTSSSKSRADDRLSRPGKRRSWHLHFARSRDRARTEIEVARVEKLMEKLSGWAGEQDDEC